MEEESNGLEGMREILNKLIENINTLDKTQRKELQQISEKMDKLVLEDIQNKNANEDWGQDYERRF